MTSIMKIQPGKLSGSIGIQPSKSVGHRMAICAALSGAGAQVYNLGRSEDILATVGSLQALGYPCELASYPEGCVLTAAGTRTNAESPRRADCGESGSTLRFLLPLALTGVLGLAAVVFIHEVAEVVVILNGLRAAKAKI